MRQREAQLRDELLEVKGSMIVLISTMLASLVQSVTTVVLSSNSGLSLVQ